MVNHFIDSDPLVAECILGTQSMDYILQIRNEFDKFGFTGTPTFVIGNKVYKGYMPYDQFKSIIIKTLLNQ
jgi:protein-disulfide isomerase